MEVVDHAGPVGAEMTTGGLLTRCGWGWGWGQGGWGLGLGWVALVGRVWGGGGGPSGTRGG